MRSLHLNAERLPDSWIFTAAFRPAQDISEAAPLTSLELHACHRIVTRHGGRCWTARSGSGTWELKFTLPRV
jgi:signal transduction histidine kinase